MDAFLLKIRVIGSEDRSLVVWDLMLGRARCTLSLNSAVVALNMSCDAARIVVQLLDCCRLPIVCLHNTPAAFVPPVNYIPAKEPEGNTTAVFCNNAADNTLAHFCASTQKFLRLSAALCSESSFGCREQYNRYHVN